jgi:hypothetical protein
MSSGPAPICPRTPTTPTISFPFAGHTSRRARTAPRGPVASHRPAMTTAGASTPSTIPSACARTPPPSGTPSACVTGPPPILRVTTTPAVTAGAVIGTGRVVTGTTVAEAAPPLPPGDDHATPMCRPLHHALLWCTRMGRVGTGMAPPGLARAWPASCKALAVGRRMAESSEWNGRQGETAGFGRRAPTAGLGGHDRLQRNARTP